MQSLRLSRAWLATTLLTILLLATVTANAAKSGRDFSGYFDVSGIHEQGELVQVTLHLKLFNHSADAKSVIVTLIDPAPTGVFRGNFQPVKVWKSNQFLEMSQQFTVTRREYEEWMAAPGQPNLTILYQDAKGQTWQKGAQISRRPLVP